MVCCISIICRENYLTIERAVLKFQGYLLQLYETSTTRLHCRQRGQMNHLTEVKGFTVHMKMCYYVSIEEGRLQSAEKSNVVHRRGRISPLVASSVCAWLPVTHMQMFKSLGVNLPTLPNGRRYISTWYMHFSSVGVCGAQWYKIHKQTSSSATLAARIFFCFIYSLHTS